MRNPRNLSDVTIRKFLSRSAFGFTDSYKSIPQVFVECWKILKKYEWKWDDYPTRDKTYNAKKKSIILTLHKLLNDELIRYELLNEQNMQPVNSKSLFHFICGQMEKLDNNEIDVQTAQAQANLAKQANNILNYELKRAETLVKVDSYNRQCGTGIKLREIEGKPFDDTLNK